MIFCDGADETLGHCASDIEFGRDVVFRCGVEPFLRMYEFCEKNGTTHTSI